MMSLGIKVRGGDMRAVVGADNGAVCVERSDKQRGWSPVVVVDVVVVVVGVGCHGVQPVMSPTLL